MSKQKHIVVVGGDRRQIHLANQLANRWQEGPVYALLLEEGYSLLERQVLSSREMGILSQCDVVIFPLPLLGQDGMLHTPLSPQKVGLAECLSLLSQNAIALGGKIPSSALELAGQKGLTLIDYIEREEFSVLNAVPTAEGAVAIALQQLPITLFEADCMVIGYGRIGKVLARLLASFGAKVTVAARSSRDLAWIRADGHQSVPLSQLEAHLPQMDVIFNTAPALVLDQQALSRLSPGCLVVDLASHPGGVDFQAAEKLGLPVQQALSLPGKTAPVTAAAITLDTIFHILQERRAIK